MEYYYTKDELYHRASGWTKKNHKYSFRKWVNNKWKYFYNTTLGGDQRKRLGGYKAQLDKDMNDYDRISWLYGQTGSDYSYDKRHNDFYKRERSRSDYINALYNYKSTPLGRLEDATAAIKRIASGNKKIKSYADKKLEELKSYKYDIHEQNKRNFLWQKHPWYNEENWKKLGNLK